MRGIADRERRLPTRNRNGRTAQLGRVAVGGAGRLGSPGSAPRLRVGLSDEDLDATCPGRRYSGVRRALCPLWRQAFGLTRLVCASSRRAEGALEEGFLAVWRNRETFD